MSEWSLVFARNRALPANPVAVGDACVLDVWRRASPQPYRLIVFVILPAKQLHIRSMSECIVCIAFWTTILFALLVDPAYRL
jgi:hypothetical protein